MNREKIFKEAARLLKRPDPVVIYQGGVSFPVVSHG
jgi:hypothetical protein